MGFTRLTAARSDAGVPVFSDDEESVLHAQPHTQLLIAPANIKVGVGTLYVTSKRVLWLPDDATRGGGYAVEYKDVLMHAISRGEEDGFRHASVYCQLEQPEEEEEEDVEDGDAEDEGKDAAAAEAEETAGPPADAVLKAGEVRFVPDNAAAVDVLYARMSEGAELNPDEAAEGEGDFFFDPASLQVAPGVNVHALLGGNTTAMEHAGEEHDDDEEDDDDEDGGYEGEGAEQQVGADVAELEVTGHRVALSSRGQPTTMEDEGGGEDVDLEHHDG